MGQQGHRALPQTLSSLQSPGPTPGPEDIFPFLLSVFRELRALVFISMYKLSPWHPQDAQTLQTGLHLPESHRQGTAHLLEPSTWKQLAALFSLPALRLHLPALTWGFSQAGTARDARPMWPLPGSLPHLGFMLSSCPREPWASLALFLGGEISYFGDDGVTPGCQAPREH